MRPNQGSKDAIDAKKENLNSHRRHHHHHQEELEVEGVVLALASKVKVDVSRPGGDFACRNAALLL